ncbi:MAG TPA: hypothetical protein VGE39_11185 [Prosthecobacter sp.]
MTPSLPNPSSRPAFFLVRAVDYRAAASPLSSRRVVFDTLALRVAWLLRVF